MKLTRRRFAMLLALTPGVGGRRLTRILARCDLLALTPEEFLALPVDAKMAEFRLPASVAQRLSQTPDAIVSTHAAMEERLEKHGITLVTTADALYPTRLEAFDPQCPAALFLYGNTRLLDARCFAVLSSRNTPPAGLDTIERLAEEGVLRSEVLVCGHDRPEYQRAAVVPLRWGSPRILGLDRGLFQALGDDLTEEPFRAARLWRYQFDPLTDLVVSVVPPTTGFKGLNNQVRDRIVAGLAHRQDFVVVREGGVMEKLLRMGLQAGCPVRVGDHSPGYREYVREGASVL
ncbi:MAG: DNA-processing protein DprA [Fimbriimonadaceae bacterium]